MFGPIAPDRKLPHTATRDTGAAGLLIGRAGPGNRTYAFSVPEELSYAAMARGLTDAFAQGFVDMLRAKEEGMDNVAPRATAIIGATGFCQWVELESAPVLAG